MKEIFSIFDGRQLLITGGTGSFGQAFVKRLLERTKVARVVIFSRDEMKQWKLESEIKDSRVRFMLGDVRDKDRLRRALSGIDYVIHAAATKIVPKAEYDPFECIKTNVIGAMNVIDASIDMGVEKVVALSTDKASSPVNLYGASKLASDKLFVASNAYASSSKTRFSVVRYGNVMGSRGSVIPFFMSKVNENTLPITDPRMTRFMISLDEGMDLVEIAFNEAFGGEIFVKKIPSMNICDIARAINPSAKHEIVGIRPGEKIHEQMIGQEDAPFTYEYDGYYKILPSINNWSSDSNRVGSGQKVGVDFVYSSDKNLNWMSIEELKMWLNINSEKFVEI